MSLTQLFEKMEKHVESYRDHKNHEVSVPGMEFSFTEACVPGDGVWQGDLGIEVVSELPNDYEEVLKLESEDLQLVPGNTQGARHCLDSLDGVRIFRPTDWTEEGLRGPGLIITQNRKIVHPRHGTIFLIPSLVYLCRYAQDFDMQQKAARRAQD